MPVTKTESLAAMKRRLTAHVLVVHHDRPLARITADVIRRAPNKATLRRKLLTEFPGYFTAFQLED